ncbi:winged helix-turn-helix domain-containing protein [Cryptosporangium sp. NPDC051539]|uniref:winged helix-turn-helix domain-containing protein n=1 Tax=Cryptosporangium sp. NPDC051539 TaxID=3363962 RepID=UPI00378B81B6
MHGDLGHPAPAFRHVADDLRRQIRSGNYAAGDCLPGDAALAERYGVSETTVRDAMEALVFEDLPARPGNKPRTVMTEDGYTLIVGRTITLAQRRDAGDLVRLWNPCLSDLQRVAVVDALAYWLGEDGDEELAEALAQLVLADSGKVRELVAVFTEQP